eukprot:s526_g8.t1
MLKPMPPGSQIYSAETPGAANVAAAEPCSIPVCSQTFKVVVYFGHGFLGAGLVSTAAAPGKVEALMASLLLPLPENAAARSSTPR